MTAYFYTDPLAAAWMAKHFGMEMHYANLNSNCDEESLRDNCLIPEFDGKIYIHPRSLHLLEPSQGDIVDYIETGMCPDCNLRYVEWCAEWGSFDAGQKIIQRNGIAFMWPESEKKKVLA